MTTGPSDPNYTYVDQVDVPGAARYLLAQANGTQDDVTAAYLGVERAALISGLSTLFFVLWNQVAGGTDGLRDWLDVMVLADRELPESGVDS